MSYSFINLYKKSKVAFETDKYLIRRRIKSKLSYNDNYLEIKVLPTSIEEMQYYIEANKAFFGEMGVNFINIALAENAELDKKLEKYLLEENFRKNELELYCLETTKANLKTADEYTVEILSKEDYTNYMQFIYEIDLEYANKEWAEHNREFMYDDIRGEEIIQIIAKDGNRIIASVNIILSEDHFEIDNLYVEKKYRKKGIASTLISYAIKKFEKKFIILVADSNDTPKYMYEKIGFDQISTRISYLKNEL
ncbi:MAG: GNAT family N-acetyltransferase [Gemella sp.]|nr:GNAT family N-acetyltransferase [Gemella sp.]